MHTKHIALIAVGALALGAVGASTLAAGEEGGAPSDQVVPAAGDAVLAISTSPTTYDDTVLTKFLNARAFEINYGGGIEDDKVSLNGQTCVHPAADSGGALTIGFASLELPDGARIKKINFYGEDSDAQDIAIALWRNRHTIESGNSASRSNTLLTSFTTSGSSGDVVFSSADDLGIVTGSSGDVHDFFNIRVEMDNVGSSHVLCGVEVEYQVPAAEAETGTVFHPIDPVRAYDSRLGFPTSGSMAPNSSRVISVKDGYTGTSVSTADAVPDGATAVTYNITVTGQTGPNFASVTPGDASDFTASAINWSSNAAIANAGTVKIDADRQIKVWAGDQAGSFQVIIDITGYYIAPVDGHPNMGN